MRITLFLTAIIAICSVYLNICLIRKNKLMKKYFVVVANYMLKTLDENKEIMNIRVSEKFEKVKKIIEKWKRETGVSDSDKLEDIL